jgi:D-alanyl-D-alanine carboxypeptidase/D-alanyl-D-alanine-endopeptidase (penicillin-binding protein 4)
MTRFLRARRAALLGVLAIALTAPLPAQGQSKTRKRTTSSKKHRPVKRSRRAAGPRIVLPGYTSPLGAPALASALGSLTARVQRGEWGAMVVSLTRGDTLFAQNVGARLMPASTMKLLTSSIAFERFGPDYQFSTDILRDGTVGPDGILHGNLYLRGDGDPALSGKFLTGGSDEPMRRLADLVAAQGIRRVAGSVIGDASGFDDQKIPEGWLTRYLQASYAARVSALSLNENLVAVAVSPSSAGQQANVSLEPSSSGIPLVNNVRTVSGGGARLSFRKQSDGTIYAAGTIGSRAGTRKYVYIVEDPASFATGALRNALIARGISVDGASRLAPTPVSATKIASLKSPPLFSMIAAMNRESINHYAELFFRDAARGPKRDAVGSVANSSRVLHDFFTDKVHADASPLYFADGSGLSTLDRVTPRAMTQLLGYAHTSSWGPWLHASLPVAGNSELLRRRMRNTPAEGNLHAKTGTTNDVIGLAGYVTAADGEVLAFTFLYNGADRWSAKSMIDVMGETLASFAR